MLNALKRLGGSKPQQANEDAALLTEMRKEREALTVLLGKLKRESVQVQETAGMLARVDAAVTLASGRLEDVATRLGSVEAAARASDALDVQMRSLTKSVRDAQSATDKLLSPDGELQRQREVVQQLAAQSMQARATLETIALERATLDRLRADLQSAQAEVQAARDRAAQVTAEAESMRLAVAESSQEQERLKETTRQTRDDASMAAATVRDVETRLLSFGKLQDLANVLDQKLAMLNVTAEHVTQKSKVLENQKHTIEQAIIQSHRLNEMVASMDAQVGRLNDGGQRATRVEETIERVEQLAREAERHLDQMALTRDALSVDLVKLDRDRTGLVEFVQQYHDRLSAERRELDAHQARVADLQSTITRIERAQETLSARESQVSALTDRASALSAQLAAVDARAAELAQKVGALEEMREDLETIDETSRRVTWQMESLKGARVDLEELRAAVQLFYAEHAEASQLRDKLSADRASLDAFLTRMGAFSAQAPELDARLNEIRSKLSTVDEGTEKAANLVSIADQLERHMTRLAGHQQFVERVEGRLLALQSVTADVDRKLVEQIERKADIEALRSACDSVLLQVTDVRQRLEGVAETQTRLLPLAAQIGVLKSDVDRAQAGLAAALRDQSELTTQEQRIARMLETLQNLSGQTAAKVEHVEGLTSALSRAEGTKTGLLKELSVVQGRQRDVSGQLQTADAQLHQLDQTVRQLEQRRDQLAFAEKRIEAFEARIDGLTTLAAALDRREGDLADRDEALQAVRREVESVREISARSKADLDALQKHRDDIVSLRSRVDELLSTAAATERQLSDIDARRRVVDEVHLKVNLITSMLDDVRVNLETVGEQKAVLDHTMTSLARLGDMVGGAQATLRALQAERELAERIERSITTLRTRTAVIEDKKRA